jgi:hypothetical protein
MAAALKHTFTIGLTSAHSVDITNTRDTLALISRNITTSK